MNCAIVHNEVRDYRRPLFERLGETYDADFYVFDESEGDYPFDVDFVCGVELFRRVRGGDYDVVVLPDFVFPEAWIAGAAARLDGAGIVAWTEVWDFPHTPLPVSTALRALAAGMARLADAFVVPGRRSEEYLLERTAARPDEVSHAPNANELPESTGEAAPLSGVPEDGPVVLFLGQVIERKRVEDVVRACEMVDVEEEVALVVGGTGDREYVSRVRRIADEERTSFLGWVADERVRDLYERADVYVLPSLRDPFPLSVVEAMSTGTPVIVSEGVGEAGDVVRHGENGEVVPTRSPAAIAASLERVLGDDGYRARLGENAARTIDERVTYDRMVEGIGRAIDAARAEREPGPSPDREETHN